MKKTRSYSLAFSLLLGASFFSAAWKEGPADTIKNEIDTSNFDTAFKPQQNFYRYINGNWLKNHPVPDAENSWDNFNVVTDVVNDQLHKILEEVSAVQHTDGSIQQKVGDYYSMYMDSNKRNKDGITPLKGEFDKIDAVTDSKSLWKEAAHLMRIGPDVMFNLGVYQDPKISSKEMCVIEEGGTALPGKYYYEDTAAHSVEIRKQYVDYVTKLFRQLKESKRHAKKDAQTVLNIETEMARSAAWDYEVRIFQPSYHKITFDFFTTMTPNIDWHAYMDELGLKSLDSVMVEAPGFMVNISEMMKTVSLEDWKTYMKFELLNHVRDKLSDKIAKISFDFWGTAIEGVAVMQPRWKRAVEEENDELGEPLGQLYVAKYISTSCRKKVGDMVSNIIAAYKERINGLTWMKDSTKKYALQKLDKMAIKLCYPDKWVDYSALDIKKDAYVLNSFRIGEWECDHDLKKLNNPVDRTEWEATPQTINAYYNPALNEIVLPAAIMQAPFFDSTRDDAMNYGSIGAFIAHELTHGFDNHGAKFDAMGNLHRWWTVKDSAHYYRSLKVLVDEFDMYTIDSIKIRGGQTVSENTADLGGLTIAYCAFIKQLELHPEGIVQGFTPQQRFFISWAQTWRENARVEYEKLLIMGDAHSLPELRANVPLTNMPEFYKAFDVKAGDAMYRADGRRAVIW